MAIVKKLYNIGKKALTRKKPNPGVVRSVIEIDLLKGPKKKKASTKKKKATPAKKKASPKPKKTLKTVAGRKATQKKRVSEMLAENRTKAKKNSPNKPIMKGKGTFAKKFKVSEGAALDPETGGSVNHARDVGTKGEKVTRGKHSVTNFFRDQTSPATRKKAKTTVELEKKKKDGTATKADKARLAKINKTDKEAYNRQRGNTIKTKQLKSDSYAKRKAKNAKTDYIDPVTGEVHGKVTPNQIQQAIKNQRARAMSPKRRELIAHLESQLPENRGLSHQKQRKGSGKNILGHKSRGEEGLGGPKREPKKRKTNGTVKRKSGGRLSPQKGWGKARTK